MIKGSPNFKKPNCYYKRLRTILYRHGSNSPTEDQAYLEYFKKESIKIIANNSRYFNKKKERFEVPLRLLLSGSEVGDGNFISIIELR